MTGIERLRTLAGAWDEWGLGGELADIADEIERERACDADTIENVRLIVGEVIDEMERHILGHEGMEDSPVARWARELRGALKSYTSDGRDTQNPSCADPDSAADVTSEAPKVTRDHAEDVSMSAYDLLPADERDAIAWVRERGGLDYVKREWRSRVPYDRYERRRQSLLGHIAECETALGRRNERIEELDGERDELYEMMRRLNDQADEMEARLMPEGMEWLVEAWPRFEDDAPVKLGDMALIDGDVDMVEAVQIWIHGKPVIYGDNGSQQLEKGERVKRPAPKVLDADGVEIELGDDLYGCESGRGPFRVSGVMSDSAEVKLMSYLNGSEFTTCAATFTHQRPVLDADGVPIKVGDTVYFTDGREHECNTVVRAKYDYKDEPYVQLGRLNEVGYPTYTNCSCIDPSQLTHERPDTWQRIEEDARWMDSGADCGMFTYTHEDLVRRCRALAERERGE